MLLNQFKQKYMSLSIILLMDANEVLQEKGPLRDFISLAGLEDIIKIINPVHATHRPTYMRS